MLLYPFTCINECIDPWSDVVVKTACGVIGTLPGEDGSFKVGHHCEMTSVGRTDACNRSLRTIGVARIGAVVVFERDVVAVKRQRQIEFSLPVRYPYTGFDSGQGSEHHRVVFRNGHSEELGFELVAYVVFHYGLLLVVGIDEV